MGDDDPPYHLVDDLDDDHVLVARIEIVRVLTAENDLMMFMAVDAAGDPLPLVEVLGMLRVTEDTAIRDQMIEG